MIRVHRGFDHTPNYEEHQSVELNVSKSLKRFNLERSWQMAERSLHRESQRTWAAKRETIP